jgi:hypothetical protein
MKKIFVIIFAALTNFSINAYSSNFEMSCTTNAGLTTSVFVYERDTKVHISWIHHNGFVYAPVHEGLITPNDLITLAKRAQKLKPLGNIIKTSFEKAKCKLFGERIFNCTDFENGKNEANGVPFQALSFYTSETTDISFAGTYKTVSAMLLIDLDNQSYFLPMRYPEEDCRKN